MRLTGDNARLGALYASDVARLIDGIERAVARTAAQLVGRAPGAAGRPPKTVARAARLRLVDIKRGSLVMELAPPDVPADQEATEQEFLDLDDPKLTDSAFSTIIGVLSGSETEFPEAATALNQLAEDLGIGERYEALALAQPGGDVPREAVLDSTARRRLAAAAQQRTRRDDEGVLVGTLYEADFERNTARLRTSHGPSVNVRFDDDHAQDIKRSLRENSQLQGRITYNEATSAIVSVDLTEIAPAEQLALMPGTDEFWSKRSLDELAQEQGVGVVHSVEELQDDTISDEEAEAFIAALGL